MQKCVNIYNYLHVKYIFVCLLHFYVPGIHVDLMWVRGEFLCRTHVPDPTSQQAPGVQAGSIVITSAPARNLEYSLSGHGLHSLHENICFRVVH